MATSHEIVDAYYSALSAMDVDRFEALHHADVVYNVSGNTIISGRYDSFAALKQVLPAIFAALDFDRFQFAVKWRVMNESPDSATAIMEAKGLARNGQRYDQRYVHIFAFRDGKIASVHEFFDTQLANDALGFNGMPPYENDGPFEF
ncbi:nuclear transport factor 2 family protein [uncultured Parasphingorhabdus sp.]|uniref:nuclear transport factor 2 family protein n=1 Tax=uncultured Parasphingorhabdus sp. TaxID=2709694 RepID=UPI0030D95F51